MRVLMMVAAVAAVSACNRGAAVNNTANKAAPANVAAPAVNTTANMAAAPQDAELAAITNSNAEAATAAAVALPTETDRDARAANCVVFLGISRDRNSRDVGFDDAAMEQAQNQWKADLRQRFSQQESDQLTGSSVNMLMPAQAAQRDAASRWCVQNAPEVDPEG